MNVDNAFGRGLGQFPEGFPGDGGPLREVDGVWFRPNVHNHFNPPNYDDWMATNPDDFRDRNWPGNAVEPHTGLPPPNHQGMEYTPGEWRHTNGDGRRGNMLRWNEPRMRDPHGNERRMQFVWPSDGKRKYPWGRWKDILSDKGPDIYVTKQGDRPSRNQWRNNFLDITPEDPIPGVDLYKNTHMPWTKRSDSTKYDFRERRYRKPKGRNDPFWSDATWPRRGADHYKQPLNYRCEHGEWFNLTWSPFGGMPLEGYNGVRLRDRGIFA